MQRGRPRIERDPNERVPMSTRIKGDVFNKLSAAADDHRWPLGHEVETRLERSFERSDLLSEALDLAYGPEAAALVLILTNAVIRAGRAAALNSAMVRGGAVHLEDTQNWPTNPYAVAEAAVAASVVFAATVPPGDPVLPPNKLAPELVEAGARAAKITLDAVCNPDWLENRPDQQRNRELERQVAEIRRLAPDLVERMKCRRTH